MVVFDCLQNIKRIAYLQVSGYTAFVFIILQHVSTISIYSSRKVYELCTG